MKRHYKQLKSANFILFVFLFQIVNLQAQDENWPQFRGKSALGHAVLESAPPIHFAPDKNILWKTELPVGHSSPCIWGDRIFLTGVIKDKKELQIICVDRNSGEIKWKQSVFPEKFERSHSISNAAISTATSDGKYVFVYFGSYGMLCYDMLGNLVWEKPMTIPKIWYGASTSPVVTSEAVLLSHDVHNNSFLLALDKETGAEIWKTELPKMGILPNTSSYSTPMIMNDQVILHRCWEISGYSIKNGERLWFLPAPSSGISTPIFHENTLYIGTWQEYGERERLGDLLDFGDMLSKNDNNGDSLISREEIPRDMILFSRPGMEENTRHVYRIFRELDKDRNGFVDENEWTKTINRYKSFFEDSGLMAFRPSGSGELPVSQVLWKITEKIPEVPSPIYCNNNVYIIKNGGYITCVDAESGEVLFLERLGVSGPYLASPVEANGKIYIPCGNGIITVIEANNELKILAKNDLEEKIYATPAIIGNVLYVRTAGNLYAFGK